ncbi:Uncharacterised protein [Yersinia frederiksenii]|nr:Uncharacterised protein [Yersinia frederiksenii]
MPRARSRTRHERNIIATETALHRTRLHTLPYKVFSVLFFYKPSRQPRRGWGFAAIRQLKRLKRISGIFSFLDLGVDRVKVLVH